MQMIEEFWDFDKKNLGWLCEHLKNKKKSDSNIFAFIRHY